MYGIEALFTPKFFFEKCTSVYLTLGTVYCTVYIFKLLQLLQVISKYQFSALSTVQFVQL